METSILVSGFGGQGALFAGQLLAYAAMSAGREVTWIPSYGPEMRGGTAHCIVIISEEPIGSPIVARPQIVLALNQPSCDKYEPLVSDGGLLVVNSSLVSVQTERASIDVVSVPANEIAGEQGNIKMANVALVGALLASRPILDVATVQQTLRERLTGAKAKLLAANLAVLSAGYRSAARLVA